MRGFFITLEGGEGSGKTTQLKLLQETFRNKNIPFIVTREPGGTEGAERIRQLVLDKDAYDWDAKAETLLFYAARLDHVTRVIMPALSQGTHVLCDRFVDSTFVYQGAGKGLDPEWINRLNRLTLENFTPDATILLDILPMEGLARAAGRHSSETRFEQMDLSFHETVRQAFLARARMAPERYAVIDAALPAPDVHMAILNQLARRLNFPVAA